MAVKKAMLAVALAALAGACTLDDGAARRPAARCLLPPPAATLIETGDAHLAGSKILERFDLPNGRAWQGSADPEGPSYRSFSRQVAASVPDPDPRRLLAASPTRNNRLVLAKAGDWIRPATCLDKLLYARQHARIPTFDAQTEFAAAVLHSSDGQRLRVYFYSVNLNGIGNASPITDPVRQDVRDGWLLDHMLHSHPFAPATPSLSGIVAPSEPDAHFQRNLAASLGLREARITNGLHSVRIPATAFADLDAGDGH